LVDNGLPENVVIDSPTKRLKSAHDNRELELKAELVEREVSAALFEARCNLVIAKRRVEAAEKDHESLKKYVG